MTLLPSCFWVSEIVTGCLNGPIAGLIYCPVWVRCAQYYTMRIMLFRGMQKEMKTGLVSATISVSQPGSIIFG